jgi:hypothetical protein
MAVSPTGDAPERLNKPRNAVDLVPLLRPEIEGEEEKVPVDRHRVCTRLDERITKGARA